MALKGKEVWRSKTVWVAGLTGVMGILAAIMAEDPELKLAGVVAILKAILDFVLRLKTDEPVRL